MERVVTGHVLMSVLPYVEDRADTILRSLFKKLLTVETKLLKANHQSPVIDSAVNMLIPIIMRKCGVLSKLY